MYRRTVAGVIVGICLLTGVRPLRAADDVTLLRVFLTDGTSLVSYGEPARVGDRVVFSIPTAATPNPPLHLVNLAANRVDWDRTNRYAESARAAQYMTTQADIDYAALSNQIAQTLTDVGATTDAPKRLALVEAARKALAEWPQNHYNYRVAEVRQMLSMLDEAIVDLRARTGAQRFDLSLSAYGDAHAIVEPLQPPPTPKDAIEQILIASKEVDSAVDRKSLLATALIGLERDADSLPADWVASTLKTTRASIVAEMRIDGNYSALSKRMLTLADRRARLADTRGLERVVKRIRQRDVALGGKRPASVESLVAAVQLKLDAVRQLKVARDRWRVRAPEFRRYRAAMTPSLKLLGDLKEPLESIKSLAGTPPAALAQLGRTIDAFTRQVTAVTPPDEVRAAHALLLSAAELARTAARIRREATVAADITRAWDASSAAAGALMLSARARSDLQAALRPPQLP